MQRYLVRIPYNMRPTKENDQCIKHGHETTHALKLDYNLPHKSISCPYQDLLIQSLYFIWWANKLQNKLVGLSHRDYNAIWLRSSRFRSGSFPQEIPPPAAGAGVLVAEDALGARVLGPLHPRAHQVLHKGETCLECPCCVLHILCNTARVRTNQVHVQSYHQWGGWYLGMVSDLIRHPWGWSQAAGRWKQAQ